MELQALPDQAFCRVHVDQRKQPCQFSVQACLRRQRMRELPWEFAFGFPVCWRCNLHAISSRVQRVAERFCLHVFHCALPLFIPKCFHHPRWKPHTLWAWNLHFRSPPFPRPWQHLVCIASIDLPIPFSNMPLWHWGARPAVILGSTQAVWHEAAPIPFRHE